MLERVYDGDKSDAGRDVALSLVQEGQVKRQLLKVSDHFSSSKKKKEMGISLSLKDVKLAKARSSGSVGAAVASYKTQYSHRSPELRRAVRLWH